MKTFFFFFLNSISRMHFVEIFWGFFFANNFGCWCCLIAIDMKLLKNIIYFFFFFSFLCDRLCKNFIWIRNNFNMCNQFLVYWATTTKNWAELTEKRVQKTESETKSNEWPFLWAIELHMQWKFDGKPPFQ